MKTIFFSSSFLILIAVIVIILILIYEKQNPTKNQIPKLNQTKSETTPIDNKPNIKPTSKPASKSTTPTSIPTSITPPTPSTPIPTTTSTINCPNISVEWTTKSPSLCEYKRNNSPIPTCPNDKIQRGVECYDPPPPGYNWTTPGGLLIGKSCPPGTNDSGTTCWYDRGVGKIRCPEGKVQRGIECYDPPPEGYDWTTSAGLLIGKVCPPGSNDSGTTCWYDRGVGTVPSCEPGKVQRGVECYDPPPEGYDWTTPGGLLIGKICPPNTNDSGTTCWYDRGVGKIRCPEGKVQRGVECYDPPPEGYDWTTPGGLLIGKICPPNTNDSGTTCWYDRGVGVLRCPPGKIQRGVECYDPPPEGYDWTTPGGLLIGKICPPGTNDSGTTCWYDRGVGRIPNKRPCPPGMRDDGISCWKDSYGRGAGRIPDKRGCPNGWRDDGTSCWSDAHIYGKGCCCTIFSTWCCGNCPQGYHDDGCTCRKTDVGIKMTLFDRQSCRNDEEMNGALCYPKCAEGYRPVGCCICEPNEGPGIKVTLGERQFCNDNEDLIGGLCYPKPRSGFNCTLTHCNFSKDVKWGNKVGLIGNNCQNNEEFSAGLCYPKPRDGFQCDATHCKFSKDVKPGNKVGLIAADCTENEVFQAGMCYPKPRDGFDCDVTHCKFSKDVKPGNKVGLITHCDSDRNLVDGMCYLKPRDGFNCTLTHCNFSKDVKWGNKTGLIGTNCKENEVFQAGMCYDKPKDGFDCDVTHCKFSKDVKLGNKVSTINTLCNPNQELIDKTCYDNPESGFKCNKEKCTMTIT